MTKHPFHIIPWDTDFLPPLKDLILKVTQGQPGQAVVIFMHDRPKRYLTDVFRHDPTLKRPCLLPRMFTIHELINAIQAEKNQNHTQPPRNAGLLDQVALLHLCVRELAHTAPHTTNAPERTDLTGVATGASDAAKTFNDPDIFDEATSLQEQFTAMDMASFFPWGTRLAKLLEECFVQGLVPEDLRYTEGEVAPFGVALLASLGQIFQRYGTLLQEHNLTTPGFEAYMVTRDLTANTPLPRLLQGKSLLVAGVGTLSGTEDTLLRYLWEGSPNSEGAHICLHVDPALARLHEGAPFHWACTGQARWIEAWKAPTKLAVAPSGRVPRLHFFAGYDLHSQLEALRSDLLACEQSATRAAPEAAPEAGSSTSTDAKTDCQTLAGVSTAVTLTHAGALLPVLHHLPRKDCNISMGYPLERSLLFQLIETIMEIRNRSLPNGKSSWRPLVDLVRHPCVRMLQANGRTLRQVLHAMEQLLRQGGRHVHIREVARQVCPALDTTQIYEENQEIGSDTYATSPVVSPELAEMLEQVLVNTVDVWQHVQTPEQAGQNLANLCETLLRWGGDLWQRFPLDAECLFRLMQRVIPALKDNAMANTPLPWPLLRSMIQELIGEERVPFEADPLTGLQVLGMLETRLLRFSQVFMVDVTDDQLPGAPTRSPLLPDTLRKVLGLPDTTQREQLAAYTFHRLLASADDAYLYWQEGVEHSGLFDGKKQRSRLVEELIWHEEQVRGQLLKPGQGPLRVDTPKMSPPLRTRQAVLKTPAIMESLARLLETPFSSTRLEAYLRCPLKFYYERLCRLTPMEDVQEEDDPAAVGLLMHTVLRRLYEPWQNQPFDAESWTLNQREQDVQALFAEELHHSGLLQTLPPESAAMLAVAGPERLMRFVHSQPLSLCVLHLEKTFDATIDVANQTRRLTGVLDRVDRREQGIHIIDYKTGTPKTLPASLWKDQTLWHTIAAALDTPEDHPALRQQKHDLLPLLAESVPSMQLLFYAYLYAHSTGDAVYNAAFVALGEGGTERPLLGNAVEKQKNALKNDKNTLQPKDEDSSAALRNKVMLGYSHDLIAFILLHLQVCPEFRPHEGPHCCWCSWNNLCIV